MVNIGEYSKIDKSICGFLSPPAAAPDSHRPNSPALLTALGERGQWTTRPQNCRVRRLKMTDPGSRPNFVHT
jgi:hypothetical protein